MENISEVVESSTWAHRCSRFQLSRRPFRAKCKLSSLSLRASAILTQSNDDAWFNFYPFNVINDKLSPFHSGPEIQICSWRSVFCYRSFPEAILRLRLRPDAKYQDINLIVADCSSSSISLTIRPLDVEFKRFI